MSHLDELAGLGMPGTERAYAGAAADAALSRVARGLAGVLAPRLARITSRRAATTAPDREPCRLS